MSAMLSAKEAAELAGVSKGAILRSIKTGRMSAQKDVRGEWQVDIAELSRVYTLHTPGARPEGSRDTPEYTPSAQHAMELMREMLERQDEVISDLRQRLDVESEKSHRLALLLEATPPAPPLQRPWWQRMFGGA